MPSFPVSPMFKGIAAGFFAYGVFSGSDASAKALGATLSVYEILFFLTLASFLTFAFAKPQDEEWPDMWRMQRPRLVLARNLSGVVGSLFAVYSFTTLPLAEAYALLFLTPALVTLLSIPILGESVGWRRWLAVAVGFAGVLLVVRPGFRELHLGHLTAIIAACLGAVSLILLRMIGRSEKRITLLATLYGCGLVLEGVLMAFDFRIPGWREVAIFTLGGFLGGVGQLAMLVATRLAPSNRVAPAQYSQVVWAIIFGAVFFGEFPDAIAFAGIGLVVASGLLTFLREEQLHGWSRRTFLLRPRQ